MLNHMMKGACETLIHVRKSFSIERILNRMLTGERLTGEGAKPFKKHIEARAFKALLLNLGGDRNMTETSNEGVVRKYYEEYNSRNLDTLMDFFADDVTWVDPSETTHDKKGLRKVLKEFYLEPFSDQKWTQDRIVSKGNTVMVEYTWSGKHVKDLAGIPAKGKRFEVHGAEIYVFEAGKIKLYKTYANPSILMQKLRE